MKTSELLGKNTFPMKEVETRNCVVTNLFDGWGNYFSAARLFYLTNGILPCIYQALGVDGKKLLHYLTEQWGRNILQRYDYYQERVNHENDFREWEVIIQFEKGLWISMESHTIYVYYANHFKADKDALSKLAAKFRSHQKETKRIFMITYSKSEFELNSVEIRKPKIDISKHYNEDLASIHPKVLKELRANNQSGLFLFYGPPGTGKSTYIRYLLRSIKKKAIFISPSLASQLDSPEFTKILIRYPDTVYIIEDAEQLLRTRNAGNDSRISTLLNLTDGLIGASLGTQFIATFNSPLQDIDPALLRTGRLKALYEFGPLCAERTTVLMDELYGEKIAENTPMTLAEIFNYKNSPVVKSIKKQTGIGFRAVVHS